MSETKEQTQQAQSVATEAKAAAATQDLSQKEMAGNAGQLSAKEATGMKAPKGYEALSFVSNDETLAKLRALEEGKDPSEEKSGELAPDESQKEGQADEAEGKQEAKSELSEREKKELERKEKSWQRLEEERQALQRARDEFEAEKAKALEAAKTIQDNQGHTPEDYERLAEELAEEGDQKTADFARRKAVELRKAQAEAGKQQQLQKLQKEWNANMRQMVEENPDLKDPESSLYKTLAGILEGTPALATYSDGILHAVKAAKAHEKAKQAEAFEKTVAELKEKVAEYEKKLHPRGGTSAPVIESSANKSLEEQAKDIKALLKSMDDQGMSIATVLKQ